MKEEWFLMTNHMVKMKGNEYIYQSVKGGMAHA